jgi:hypothetical protein
MGKACTARRAISIRAMKMFVWSELIKELKRPRKRAKVRARALEAAMLASPCPYRTSLWYPLLIYHNNFK